MENSISGPIILLLYAIYFFETQAITCYKCNSNEIEQCVDEPDELPASSKAECNGYCTIIRTEHTDIPGLVLTLARDCEKRPLVLNGVRKDKQYTIMYTSCDTSAQCNSGDGKRGD